MAVDQYQRKTEMKSLSESPPIRCVIFSAKPRVYDRIVSVYLSILLLEFDFHFSLVLDFVILFILVWIERNLNSLEEYSGMD